MKTFLALLSARNKEFYRDKGSLGWAIIFPIMAIIGCALVFQSDEEKLLRIGIFAEPQVSANVDTFLKQGFNEVITYKDKTQAIERIKQHQLHAFIDTKEKQFWINPQSSQGKIFTQLAAQQLANYQKHAISGKALRYVDWVFPGILGMNIMFGALFGVGYVIVRYRKNGVLKRLNATPISSMQFLTAQITSRLLIILTANFVIFLGALLLLDLTMNGSFFNLFIALLLGSTSMISIGLIISSRTESEELAGGLLNLITWPMMFLSGVWFSMDGSAQWIQSIANFFPLTHLVHACREILLNGASLWDIRVSLIIMLAMSVIFLSIGAYLFRWHKE